MTKRSPYLVNRAFRSYLAATVMSTMAVSFGTMLGSIVVGNVMGPTALGAVNVMMPVIQLLAALNALINIGGATVMAVNVGRGRTDEVRGIFTKSMLMSLAVSVAIAVVGVLFIDEIMSMLCTDDELLGMAREYGLLVFAMSPMFVIMPGLGAYVRTDNSPRLAMASFIAMNATDLVLSFVFMEYLDMGLTGFALGTGIGYVVGLAVLIPHFIGRGSAIGIGWGSVGCSEILTMGAPTALGMGMIMVNMLGINLLVMDNLGSDGMAIRSVCTNVQMISSIFVSGISQTLQPVGGSLYGSEDLTGMRMVVGIATRYQLAVAAAITLITLAVPTVFLTLYGVTDPSIHDVAVEDLRLFAPYILFQAANYFIMVIYQVFGHRPIAMSISVMECAFILVVAYILTPFSTDFIWLSFVIGESLVTAVIVIMSLAIRHRYPEFSGIALLRSPSGEVMDTSMSGDGSEMSQVLDETSAFLGSAGVDRVLSERVRLCCEEILLNVVDHGVRRDPERFVDLMVRVDGDDIKVTIRDDGPIFDPVKYDEESGYGLMIVRGECTTLNYARSMDQNNVFIGFSMARNGVGA